MIPVPFYLGRINITAETAAAIVIGGGVLILLESLLFSFSLTVFLLGFLIGGAIAALGGAARVQRRNRSQLAVGVVVLGVVSLFVVSGFYLGSALTILGGILLVSARSAAFQNPVASTFTSDSLGPPCPRCGQRIPTWTSKCPYCGFPDAVSE